MIPDPLRHFGDDFTAYPANDDDDDRGPMSVAVFATVVAAGAILVALAAGLQIAGVFGR